MAERYPIRTAHPEDLTRVAAIEAVSFGDPWSLGDFRELVAAPGVQSWVAIGPADTILGYLVTRRAADEGEILNLAVDPAWRGRGVGDALVAHGLDTLRRLEVSEVFLEVRRSNAAAVALYGRRGFALVGARRGYYRTPVEDALVLCCRLGSTEQNEPDD